MLVRIAKFRIFVLFCSLVLLFSGCSSDSSKKDLIPGSFVAANNSVLVDVKLEVANTPALRTLGLMYRDSLESNHGMIFIFRDEQIQSFWMKNTKIPLDIIFLDSNFKVVAIQHNATPYSEAPRDSKGKPSKYVVELIGGSCHKYGISEGSTLIIRDTNLPDAL